MDAVEADNVAAVDSLLAPGMVNIAPDGDVKTRSQLMAMHQSGARKMTRFDIEQMETRVYGNDVAVVTGKVTAEGKHGARAALTPTMASRVWTKGADGRWQLLVSAATLITAPAENASTAILPAGATWAEGTDAADSAGIASAISALEARYSDALEANATATLDSLQADDAVVISGSGERLGIEQHLSAVTNGTRKFSKHDMSDVKITVHGNDAAVVTYTGKIQGTEGGASMPGTRMVHVWHASPTGWQVVFIQVVRIKA
jgi:ketosteroid isomerase-like protein